MGSCVIRRTSSHCLVEKCLKKCQFVSHLLYLFIVFFFISTFVFQEVETGERGTSGVCAQRHAIQAGSTAFGCVKAQESRITPVMDQGRKCAPAMTRSAQVCVCVVVSLFSNRSNMYPSLISRSRNQIAFVFSSSWFIPSFSFFFFSLPFSYAFCLFWVFFHFLPACLSVHL